MRLKIIVFISMLCLMVGCSSTNNQSEQQEEKSPQTSNTGYETGDDHIQKPNRTTKENNENKKRINNSPTKDIFTSDASMKMQEILTNRQDIKQAQVALTQTRAIIAVKPSMHADRDQLLDAIENEVKHMVPKKEIVIYTDDSYWNRMKNLGSQLKNLTDDDEIDEYIDEHFFEY